MSTSQASSNELTRTETTRARSRASDDASRSPVVSVIVPVRDRRDYLLRLLSALEEQTIDPADFEVIVSDDGSVEPLVDDKRGHDWLRVVRGPRTNSYAARNRGAAEARGRILAFTDADCSPAPEWLEAGLRAVESSDIVAGHVTFEPPRKRTTWAFIDMETSKNQELNVRLGVAETANLFVHREAFDSLGGFSQEIAEHGDFDFAERAVTAGYRLTYSEAASVRHPVRVSGRVLLRTHWVYTRAYAERVTRRGERPFALRLRSWFPIVPVVRQRRRVGMSLDGPDRAWLAANGVVLTPIERLKTLPLLYLFLPYFRQVAQVHGWIRGLREGVG